jgi:hypothetical protein
MAVLVALVGGTGRAQAVGGTYRVSAGGDQNWSPTSGATDQTASDPIEVTGTMVGTGGAVGSVDYHVASGPGIVRTRLAGVVTVPSNLAYPFNPSTQAVSTTELTVSGPSGEITTSVNVHVDGVIETPVCGTELPCGALGVHIEIGPFVRVSEFDTLPETRANGLGLAFDPVPGGYRVHGDVTSAPLVLPTNQPVPITIVLNLSGRFAGRSAPSTFAGDFDDPAKGYQVSFAPSGPVLNDIPAGYTVSGPSVTDNHWTNPFAPPSGDVVVSDCADPTLAQLTTVHGSLVIRNLPGCTGISLSNLTRVDGDLLIEGNPHLSSIGVGGAAGSVTIGGDLDISGNSGTTVIDAGAGSVGGSIDISGNTGTMVIDAGAGSVGGSIDISGNTGTTVIDAGAGSVGGSVTIEDNGDAIVNVDVDSVGGDLTLETAGDTASATTGGGTTDVTILGGTAAMHVVLPAGTFDQPVAFTITRTSDAPPEVGTASDGAPAQIDPIMGYRFAFAVPTLDADAQLTFTVDLAQLDAVGRATLLDAIGAGTGTVAVKGDDPGATYHALAQCTGTQTPAADGCAAVTLLKADGAPASSNDAPAFARFDGVAGHFSSYAVVHVLPLDTTPPVVTVPASIAVDATGPLGAHVTYAASARDDRDPSPSLVCTPASGGIFPIGDTDVACTATDGTGNAATARLVVHVRGAGEQIMRLVDKTAAFLDLPALRPALRVALQSTVDAILAKRPRSACRALEVYVAIVRSAPVRALTPAERSELIADAVRIEAVIGC